MTKNEKMYAWIMINYPLIFKLLKGNPPGLSVDGWKAVYKELRKDVR